MDGTVAAFARTVRIETCRVINTPNVILLCGGSTGGDSEPVKSARDYFYRYLRRNHKGIADRVKLAETINNWFDQDTFPDLLRLEEYLADLSDLIILFVESPGSIAELGAFAVSESLLPKTLAILNNAHPQARTFIADGPVRRLRTAKTNLVRYYDWNSAAPSDSANQETFEYLSQEISQLLIERERDAPREQRLSKSSHAHTMLLVADIIDIVGILTIEDIVECLAAWSHSTSRKDVRRYLSLLEHLAIIRPWPYSNQNFYVSNATSAFIRYSFKRGTADRDRDRDRIKRTARAKIGERTDARAKALRSYALKLTKGGGYV